MIHSRISPSSLDRIMMCPASVTLAEGMPNYDSEWAAEGTVAHNITTRCLRGAPIPNAIKLCNRCNNEFDGVACSKCGDREFRIDAGLLRAIEDCVRFCNQLGNDSANTLLREQDVRIESGLIEKFGGTLDFLTIYTDEAHRTWLHVVDFKFGQGVPVTIDGNSQVMAYLLLARERFPKIKWFRGTIIQPRIGSGKPATAEFSLLQLQNFFTELVDTSVAIEIRKDTYQEGPHCRWCPAAIKCPAVGKTALELVESSSTLRTDEELRALYTRFVRSQKAIRALLTSIPQIVIQQMREGVEFPGLKTTIAHTHRRWIADAADTLRFAGVPDEDLWQEPKLVTPAQLESKGYQNLVAQLSYRPIGTPTVVATEETRDVADIFTTEFPDP